MSDKPNVPFNSWLPRLEADRRFPESTGTLTATFAGSAPDQEPPASTGVDWLSALEAQFGLTASTGPAPVSKPDQGDDESVESLRERLAYYEHFDALIRDNVARSADLFRAIFAAKERLAPVVPTQPVDEETLAAEQDLRLQSERVHMQHILLSLMDEATYLQQRADGLIQHLAEALTELASYLPGEDEPVSGA